MRIINIINESLLLSFVAALLGVSLPILYYLIKIYYINIF